MLPDEAAEGLGAIGEGAVTPRDCGGNGEKRCCPGCRTHRVCHAFYDDHRAVSARAGLPLVIMSLIVRFPTPTGWPGFTNPKALDRLRMYSFTGLPPRRSLTI